MTSARHRVDLVSDQARSVPLMTRAAHGTRARQDRRKLASVVLQVVSGT
jgi:hypothetical protein